MSNDSQQIVNKAWNFAHVLRDDGLSNILVPQDEPASVLLERLRVEAASRRLPSDKDYGRQDAPSTGRKRRAKS